MYTETPHIQTPNILNFRKSKNISRKLEDKHAKWKEITYLAIITTKNNSKSQNLKTKLKQDSSSRQHAQNNKQELSKVLWERRDRGCDLEAGADWNSIFRACTPNKGELATLCHLLPFYFGDLTHCTPNWLLSIVTVYFLANLNKFKYEEDSTPIRLDLRGFLNWYFG